MVSSILLSLLAPLIVKPILIGIGLMTVLSFLHGGRWERVVTATSIGVLTIATFATFSSVLLMWWSGTWEVTVMQLHLASISSHPMGILLRLDGLSLPFLIATCTLCNIVAVFSRNYLHRDPGHHRFFFLVLFFCFGMQLIILGATLEVIFMGWEMIGLSSALLISFFHERKSTAENSLRAFGAYRMSDAALLLAALLVGSSHGGSAAPVVIESMAVPALILLAAMPKSAQFPFFSWLPRAMEGPTPSSAIFYGGLSVHAGLYLILRAAHDFVLPSWYFLALVIVGGTTAVLGSILSKVQTDIKGALAYASMTQVGVMFVEVGIGFYYLVLFHFLGHAMLRTYQILSAGGILHEHRTEAMRGRGLYSRLPVQLRSALYAFAMSESLGDGAGPGTVVRWIEWLSRQLSFLENMAVSRLASGVERTVARALPDYLSVPPSKGEK